MTGQHRDLVADFARAPHGAVFVGDVAAGCGVERGRVVYKKTVHVASANQFHFGVPNAIDAFAHAASQCLVTFGQADDQRNVLRVGCAESKGNGFIVIAIL